MATVSAQKLVLAPLGQVFRAFTNATSLCEWLCNVATVSPHPRGRMYLWWNGDFYSSGHYLELEENKLVKFRWYSSIDPAPTEVSVTFEEQAGGILVTMSHHVPDDPSWSKMAEGFRQNWDSSMDNLKSVLETGIDRRIADRPMIGIIPSDFSADIGQKLGIPVSEGLRLGGVVEGMGAYNAGLRENDVVVALDGKTITNAPDSFANAIAGKKGGDEVEVTYYRGAEKTTVKMTLSRRPMAQVPFNAGELVMQASPKYDAAYKELQQCFEGVSDEEARARPAPGEWSALEVLAHILQGERALHFFIDDLVGGFERSGDDWGGNIDSHIRATAATFPTLKAMLEELKRACEETLYFVAELPAEFAQNKGSFYRVGNFVLLNDQHIYSHIEQIKKAIAAAKKSGAVFAKD
jgi:uncharacterized protein YndB with AHSA1/START domain